MTEFEKADLNNNGVIEKAEWNKLALEDRRLEMIDQTSNVMQSVDLQGLRWQEC